MLDESRAWGSDLALALTKQSKTLQSKNHSLLWRLLITQSISPFVCVCVFVAIVFFLPDTLRFQALSTKRERWQKR